MKIRRSNCQRAYAIFEKLHLFIMRYSQEFPLFTNSNSLAYDCLQPLASLALGKAVLGLTCSVGNDHGLWYLFFQSTTTN